MHLCEVPGGASRKHSRVNLPITGFWKLFSFQMWQTPFLHLWTLLNICLVKLSLCSPNPPLDSLHLGSGTVQLAAKFKSDRRRAAAAAALVVCTNIRRTSFWSHLTWCSKTKRTLFSKYEVFWADYTNQNWVCCDSGAWGPRALWSVPLDSIVRSSALSKPRYNWVIHRAWALSRLLKISLEQLFRLVGQSAGQQDIVRNQARFVDLQPAASNQHGQTKRKIQISHFPSPFSKPQNALWRQNLDAHLIGGRIWGGNRGLEISCHLYTQGTPATHRYLCLNWISLSIPTIFELSFVEDLSVFNLYSLPARLFWFPRRVRRR